MPITIDKAIEILSDSANRGMTTFNQDRKDAENLGIEALKLLARLRDKAEIQVYPMLPSETIGGDNVS